MKILKYFVLAFILLGTQQSLLSQEYFFRSYSIEQGLPQSTIYCALEDSRGEMWIGTEGSGVARFNGIEVEVYDRANGLSDNIVRALFEDSNGNIWIGTNSGLNKYDGYSLQSISNTKINESPVLTINEDRSGNLWIGTQSQGLFRLEFGDSLVIDNYTVSEGLANMFIFDIDVDNDDRLWCSLIGGVNIVEYTEDNFQVTKLIEGYDIPSGNILCGSMDSNGDMWFGTYQEGVFKVEAGDDLTNVKSTTPDFLDFLSFERVWDIRWTGKNECFVATEDQGVIHFNEQGILNHFTKDNGITTNQIYRITESRNGDIWFSTLGNGILKYENRMFVNYRGGVGINGTQIFAVETNANEDLLIGTDEGLSAYSFEGDHPSLVANYNTNNGLPSSEITSIACSGNITWLAGSNGVAKLENGRISMPEFNAGLRGQNVYCLMVDSEENLLIGTSSGYSIYINNELHQINLVEKGFDSNDVQTILEHSSGDIYMGTMVGLMKRHGEDLTSFDKAEGLMELNINALAEDKNGDVWIGTFGGGIFLFSQEYDSIPIQQIAGNDILSSNNIYSLVFLNDSVLVAATESGFDEITIGPNNTVVQSIHYDVNDGFPGGGNNLNALVVDQGLVWFGNNEGLVKFDPSQRSDQAPPELQINRLKLFFEEQDWKTYGPTVPWFNIPDNLMLPYHDDHLTIGFSSIFYGNHSGLSYSYFLDGQSKDWSPYIQSREVDFPGLRPGKYNFQVKAKNKYGMAGDISSISFEIKPPFWMQPWFIILVILILFASVILYVRWRTRKLQLEKIQLEKIVKERTHEVVMQKEHIEKQHDIVVQQNDEIEASIHYAERIQKAVVPSEDILKNNFDDSFILWRPQHIVSGDFYWVGEKGDNVIFAAADCTGHGVPGAFMSMLGVSYLNQIVLEENTVKPSEILDKLRDHIINSFSQKEQGEAERKDGMDIALCTYNKKTKKLYYAGAYNPLFLIRDSGEGPELIEHNADKMPVGLYAIMDGFKTIEVDYHKGDSIYMFSDGFPDQFGGERFKKFMKKRFREMILSNHGKSLPDQKQVFDDTLEAWMGFKDQEGGEIIQTDDVLVVSVKM